MRRQFLYIENVHKIGMKYWNGWMGCVVPDPNPNPNPNPTTSKKIKLVIINH